MSIDNNGTRHSLTRKPNGFIVGRFQLPHNEHIQFIREVLAKDIDKLYVCLGSSFQPRSLRNPFTAEEREELIRSCFDKSDNDKLVFVPIPDFEKDSDWFKYIQNSISHISSAFIHSWSMPYLYYCGNDPSSYYSKYFNVKFKIDLPKKLHSSRIRYKWYAYCELDENIPEPIRTRLQLEPYVSIRDQMSDLRSKQEEYEVHYGSGPFTTVDTLLYCTNTESILLIKRKDTGLWALPGGFVSSDESLVDASKRELQEETGVKLTGVPSKGPIVYDKPDRDDRARIITNVFVYVTGQSKPPRAADDAKYACFVPLKMLPGPDQFYADHHKIITDLTADYRKG